MVHKAAVMAPDGVDARWRRVVVECTMPAAVVPHHRIR
jgi:hypothetical protein